MSKDDNIRMVQARLRRDEPDDLQVIKIIEKWEASATPYEKRKGLKTQKQAIVQALLEWSGQAPIDSASSVDLSEVLHHLSVLQDQNARLLDMVANRSLADFVHPETGETAESYVSDELRLTDEALRNISDAPHIVMDDEEGELDDNW